MTITPPLKKAPYEFRSLGELKKLIAQRGQFFGEDKSEDACKYRPDYPCGISLYKYWGMTGHNGLDIPCNDSEPIIASHDGLVVETSSDESAGLGVVLWDDVQLIKTIYWHLKSFPVKVGDRVKQGDVIGLADNTGFSSGTHLHFGLKQTNQNGTTINYENGYAGSIDPWPYLVWFQNNMLDKEDVKFLQALEGFHDEAGVDFWGDGTHTLKEYKTARVPDKVKELTNLQ